MIPYATYREPDEVGRICFFILQKAFPNYVGLLVTNPVEGAIINVPIADYNLWITFNGTIAGNFIPAWKGVTNDITQVFYSMAEWYYINRVKGEKKYEKFKLKQDADKSVR